jgi:hypothetical protein
MTSDNRSGGGKQPPRGRGRRQERRHPDRDRPDNRRTALAAEAARIMQEQGLTDFRDAKAKAVERLGLGRNAPLPDNQEIAAALAERNRIFHGDSQPQVLRALRETALAAMELLAEFHPRLVGDVLSGIAGDHAGVDLHLFSDSPEAVGAALDGLGIAWRGSERRHRLRRDETESFPALRFVLADCDVVTSVFPLRLRGHPPLSPVDGRPMRRASAREVAELLADESQL